MKKIILLLAMGAALSTQTLFAQVPSYVPTNGLVGYWPFNGNANDESGNGNNGTVNGATLTTDRLGASNSAYSFNGNGQYIQAPNQSLQGSVTFSGWYKMATYNLSQADIFFFANNTPTNSILDCNFAVGYRYDAGTGQYGHSTYPRSNSNLTGYYALNQIPSADVWHHFVCVFNNGIFVKMYLDNNLFYTNTTVVSNTSIPSLPMLIGYAGQGYSFTGQLDDIGIWNRVLTEQEITNIYNSSLPQTACLPANVPTTGLVGYWPFCGNANDESGNGNNGTNNGATLTTDRFGNANSAYSFDGVNDFIIVNNNPNILYPEFTVTIWFNSITSFCDAIGPIIRSGNASTCGWNGFSIGTFNNDNNFGLQNFDGSDYSFQSNQLCSNFNSGTWYNITFTRSNSESREYVNGILVSSVLQSNYQPATQCPIFFGSNHLDSNNNPLSVFNGKVDDIGIWNRALTQEEITNLYNVNQCITNITVTDTLIINVGQLSFNDPVTWANNITIAPNPASSQINISFNNITNLNGGTLKIINSLGQEVATTPITTSGTNSTMQLATWGGTGMYFVHIINPQGQIVDIKKIILQ
ncbi:MAG: LamG-like jellyroll fold domain-containing protein [Flavobacterium sp.]|uniref:LamG-like jellyroll fold domain-containing protein n=1 Tax=Flavobacterium sp. TaxID=239 RepID=UPI003BE872B3